MQFFLRERVAFVDEKTRFSIVGDHEKHTAKFISI